MFDAHRSAATRSAAWPAIALGIAPVERERIEEHHEAQQSERDTREPRVP